MTTTLLAVDDSKTMRKVLETTFAGEDYRTILAEGSADALAKLRADNPALALVDANLGEESGYDLCQRIKQNSPGVMVLMLTSKQQPYDRAKGASAGADDFMDKPFDTQQLIDKVVGLVRRTAEAPAAAPRAPAPAAQAPPPAAARPAVVPIGGARPSPPSATAGGPPAMKAPMMGQTAGARPPGPPAGTQHVATTPGIPGVQLRPAAPPVAAGRPIVGAAQPGSLARPPSSPQGAPAPAAAVPAPPPAAVSAAGLLPSDLQSKLQGLGLTQEQLQGVLALSKDVVERVVWEVVPQLAEAIIKEELQRLTSD